MSFLNANFAYVVNLSGRGFRYLIIGACNEVRHEKGSDYSRKVRRKNQMDFIELKEQLYQSLATPLCAIPLN